MGVTVYYFNNLAQRLFFVNKKTMAVLHVEVQNTNKLFYMSYLILLYPDWNAPQGKYLSLVVQGSLEMRLCATHALLYSTTPIIIYSYMVSCELS